MDSAPPPRQQRLGELRRKLTALAAETAQTEDEIAALESDAGLAFEAPSSTPTPPRTPAEKVALFLDLFGTRRSVYPKRWENQKTGRNGYDDERSRQQLIPNPGEATVLKRIFDRAGELASLGQIAAELTHEGVRSGVRWQKCGLRERRSIGGRVFRTDVLRKIIGNPLYRGVICYGGKEYTGQHEPLVGKEAWELANAAILEPRNKRAIRLRDRDTHSNLLKGILVCEVCQQPLLGKASGKPSRSGSHYRYYHCAGRPLQREAKPACQVGNLPAPVLEKLVVTFLGLIPKQ